MSIQSPIIVLGMHRSGTSLLTGCLQAAGVYLGEVNDKAKFNKKGNKENIPIRNLHESILSRHGLSWKQPGDVPMTWSVDEKNELLELVSPYQKIDRPWGVKDPRTIWLLDYWLEAFPNARFIAVFRHPVLVARSLGVRKGALSMSVDASFKLWCDTNEKILKLKNELGFPLLHFSGSTELEKVFFNPLNDFCKQFGCESDPSTFFDRSLVNQADPGDELPEQVAKIYERLLEQRSVFV